MPFEPRHQRHAIDQVAIAIHYERAFSRGELEDLAENHSQWLEYLPKMERDEVILVPINPPQGQIPIPPRPVKFQSFKRDGSIDWRLSARDNVIFVNCLDYNRWEQVWKTARKYLSFLAPFLLEKNQITQFALQYNDLFRWDGSISNIDFSQLLCKSSETIPNNIWNKGAVWHLHTGWFDSVEKPNPGRVLIRTHIDAVVEQGVSNTKIESVLRYELEQSLRASAILASHPVDPIDDIFSYLHSRHKQQFSSYLTPEMRNRINLHAG